MIELRRNNSTKQYAIIITDPTPEEKELINRAAEINRIQRQSQVQTYHVQVFDNSMNKLIVSLDTTDYQAADKLAASYYFDDYGNPNNPRYVIDLDRIPGQGSNYGQSIGTLEYHRSQHETKIEIDFNAPKEEIDNKLSQLINSSNPNVAAFGDNIAASLSKSETDTDLDDSTYDFFSDFEI